MPRNLLAVVTRRTAEMSGNITRGARDWIVTT